MPPAGVVYGSPLSVSISTLPVSPSRVRGTTNARQTLLQHTCVEIQYLQVQSRRVFSERLSLSLNLFFCSFFVELFRECASVRGKAREGRQSDRATPRVELMRVEETTVNSSWSDYI